MSNSVFYDCLRTAYVLAGADTDHVKVMISQDQIV